MNWSHSFYESLDEHVDFAGNEFYGCAERDDSYCGEVCPSPCYLGGEGCDSQPDAGERFSRLLSGEL